MVYFMIRFFFKWILYSSRYVMQPINENAFCLHAQFGIPEFCFPSSVCDSVVCFVCLFFAFRPIQSIVVCSAWFRSKIGLIPFPSAWFHSIIGLILNRSAWFHSKIGLIPFRFVSFRSAFPSYISQFSPTPNPNPNSCSSPLSLEGCWNSFKTYAGR